MTSALSATPDPAVPPVGRSAEAVEVIVVPHTHWDREWYSPFPTFRLRLLDLLDELLPRLEADPGFAHFQLDGQMAVVDDYLELRPAERSRIGALAAAGRLSMGPWYVLPDEFLVSGETLVRNLQVGLARAEEFGGAMEVGYLPDMFGHVAQMPQLLDAFGFTDAVVWRGVPSTICAPAFEWEALDGSTVRAEYLPAGYGNGSELPADPEGVRRRLDLFRALQGPLVGDRILLMAGMDHEIPPAHLAGAVTATDRAEAERPDGDGARYHLRIASLADYLAGAPSDALPRHRGELRSGARANLLMGVASNRVDVKQAAAVAERTLERIAEPLAALWLPHPERWRPVLDSAWLEVLRNAAHDSICACSHDEVGDAVLHRYHEATRTASGIADRAVGAALARMHEAGAFVLNPSARTRAGVVELDLPGDAAAVAAGGAQVLAERAAEEELRRVAAADAPLVVATTMLGDHPEVRSVRFVDEGPDATGDQVVGVHLLPDPPPARTGPDPIGEAGEMTLGTESALAHIGRRCAAEPGLVARLVLHRGEPSCRSLALTPPVPGFGWTRWEPVAPASPVTPLGPHGLTNGLVDVEVDPDTGDVRIDGRGGFLRLVDDGDAGDTYNWSPPAHDLVVDAPVSVSIERPEQGPVRGRLVLVRTYRWPERLTGPDGDEARTGEVTTEVRTSLEVLADDPLLRVTVEFDHRQRDHRLRLHLPLPRRSDRSEAECAYAVVSRPLWAEGGPNEWGVPTFPSRRFVRAGGLTVTHEGLCEYELVDLDGDAEDPDTTAGELAVTLVRATGWLSRGPMASRPLPAGPTDRLEGPQVPGPHALRLALSVDRPGLPALDPHDAAESVWLPLPTGTAPGGGDLPATGSRLALQLEGADGGRGPEVDAVLRDDDDRLVVRLHDPEGEGGTVTVPDGAATEVDLRGRPTGRSGARLAIGPWKISTLRLSTR
jgi:mannosylglycerate hydrolase